MQDIRNSVHSVRLQVCCSQLRIDTDQQAIPAVPVVSVGSEAARILRKARTGRILAVFKRSFYVQCDQGIFCIGLASLGRGPLNVLLDSGYDQVLKKVTRDGSLNIRCSSSCGAECCVDRHHESDARNNGKFYSGTVSADHMNPLLLPHILREYAVLITPEQQGFGWIVFNAGWQKQNAISETSGARPSTVDASLRRQCFPALLCLSEWLQTSLKSETAHARIASAGSGNSRVVRTQNATAMQNHTCLKFPALLGAGPGLTPAGDDLLAGVILALHRINRVDLADAIWQCLEPVLMSRTNIISSAHLRQAAQGQCSEPVCQLLDGVFHPTDGGSPGDLKAQAVEIQNLARQIGASSGWDTLAGMSLVLYAL